MALRTVSIKIQLDGYSEYRSTIANLNAQNRLLEAKLKDLDREYGNNSKSADKLAKQQGVLVEQYNLHKKGLEELEKLIPQATQKMHEWGNTVDDSKNKIANTQGTLDTLQQQLFDATKNMEYWINAEGDNQNEIEASIELWDAIKQSIDDTKVQLAEETKELIENTKEYTNHLSAVAKLEDERNDTLKTLDNINDKIDANSKILSDNATAQKDVEKATEDTSDALNGLNPSLDTNMDKVGKVIDVYQVFTDALRLGKEAVGKVKDAIDESINAFIDYEAAFANVEKTVNGSKAQLAELNDEIKEMSSRLPYATAEIAEVASLAGQLGVETPEIAKFTEVMLGLGVATNLTSDEAATMLAQFQNVTGFEADKIQNIASVIVDLGNNSATTEKNILEMSQRFASAGTLAGLSAPEILGMATALASVGVNSEAGGTSLSKLVQKIQVSVETEDKYLSQFARISGKSAEDFSKAWRESPVEAINMFISGLHETYEAGDPVLELLEEVGFSEIRLRQATQSLATSEKGLAYYVDMANSAFKDTSAYDTEVGRFLDTTKSEVEILNNNIELLKIQVGEELSPAFDDLTKSKGEFVEKLSMFIDQNPIVIEAMKGLIGVLTGVFDILGLLIGEFTTYEGNIERFGSIANNTSSVIGDTTRAYADQQRAIEDTVSAAEPYLEVLQNIEADGKVTRDEQEKYNDAIEELKKLFPELNIEIDKKTGKIKGGTAAIREQIDAWQELAMAEAKQKRMIALYENLYDVQAELSDNTKKYANNQKELDRIERERESKGERYIYLTNRRKDLTAEEAEELKKLHKYMTDSKDRMDELEQEQADLEVAIIGGKDAINDSWNAIKNWEGVIDDATKATQDNTEAVKENAESYDQSEKSAEGGEKTIAAYVNGQLKYFTSDEWQKYREQVRKESVDVFSGKKLLADTTTAGGKLINAYAKGIWSSKDTVIQAGKMINDTLASTLRKNDFKWKFKVSNGIGSYVAMFAEGGIVDRPTNAIVGEAGTEAIIPLKKLPDIMSQMMQNQASMDGFNRGATKSEAAQINSIASMLGRYLPQMSNMQVVMDGNRLVGAIAPKIDTYFANQQLAEERGQ